MKYKHRRLRQVQPSVFPSSLPDVYTSIAPYVSAPLSVVRKMLEFARLKSGEILYDLGSGDGRIVLMAAKEFGAKGRGVELIDALVNEAKRRAITMGLLDDVEFIKGNLFDVNFSSADVVTMYLLKRSMEKVRVRLEETLKAGARVVTLDYLITKWRYDEILEIDDTSPKHTVYLYIWHPAEKQ
jgi:predicted RNA methylase